MSTLEEDVNEILEHAQGEYEAFLDSSDEWNKGYYQGIIDTCENILRKLKGYV